MQVQLRDVTKMRVDAYGKTSRIFARQGVGPVPLFGLPLVCLLLFGVMLRNSNFHAVLCDFRFFCGLTFYRKIVTRDIPKTVHVGEKARIIQISGVSGLESFAEDRGQLLINRIVCMSVK